VGAPAATADLYQYRDPEKAVEYRHQAQQIRRT